jgi:hypothetical protein
MVQLDLFDNPQLSRRTDKSTSHEAGDGVRKLLGLKQQRCLFMLAGKQLTAMEVSQLCSDYYGGLVESYRKRLHELVREKLIEELPPRECSVTGKNATVYKRASQ